MGGKKDLIVYWQLYYAIQLEVRFVIRNVQ